MTHNDIRLKLRELGFESRDLIHALRLFQRAYRIPVTGEADDLTLRNLFGSPQPQPTDGAPTVTTGFLHPDWKKLLRHAWSVRLMALSFVFQALEVAMPYLEKIPTIPQGVLATLAVVSLAGGIFSRFVLQKEFKNAD